MSYKLTRLMITLMLCGVTVFAVSLAIGSPKLPAGWFPAGSHPQDYDMGVDLTTTHGGKASGYIKSKAPAPRGFGTLMQQFKADIYRGERLRLSGYAKAEKIENWAGLWVRVDGAKNEMLSFDNMSNRPLKGTTDWGKHEIVLDVPGNSAIVAFGILLQGKGQVWADDLKFEVVSRDVPTTDMKETGEGVPRQPLNLDFEAGNTKKLRSEEARRAAVQLAIDNFALVLDMFELDNGRYPTTEQGLKVLLTEPRTIPELKNWGGPYIKKPRFNDPWGNPYVYSSPGPGDKSYELKSYGPDGKEGGGDDIVAD